MDTSSGSTDDLSIEVNYDSKETIYGTIASSTEDGTNFYTSGDDAQF